jgi:hypothetical protein
MLTTAAFIGGAGILAGAPAAAFLAAPAASAQPQSHCATSVLATPCTAADPTLGDGSIAELTARLTARTPADPLAPGWLTARAPSDPFVSLLNSPLMDLAGMVPVLNLFIGNGMDGTALHPNGFGGGFFIGNGGDGWNSTTPGVAGGNGGSGLLFGSGGKGGNGYSDIRTSGDATGTNGGKGGSGGLYGGSGGAGGEGGDAITYGATATAGQGGIGGGVSNGKGNGGDGGDGGYAYGGSIVTTDPATGLQTVQAGTAVGGAGGRGGSS